MKLSSAIIVLLTVLYVGCKSHKEATASAAQPAPPVAATPPPAAPAPPPAAALSTEDLVKAAKTKWPDVTAQTIDEGKQLYTSGACVDCHGAKKITRISEEEWPSIMDRMAPKAHISDMQKDAVLKYVLAVKMASK